MWLVWQLTITTAFMASMPRLWNLESLTIGPMYHEADATFWEAALKDFPSLPHLTKVRIIYHYRTPKAFNTSCWVRLNRILSNRGMYPRLEVLDVCPTFRSQRLGWRKLSDVMSALQSIDPSGRKLTHWGNTCEVVFIRLGAFWSSPYSRNSDW